VRSELHAELGTMSESISTFWIKFQKYISVGRSAVVFVDLGDDDG
jgi:hypothetical protein